MTGLAAVLCVGIRESRPSQLLGHRLRAIQKLTGDNSLHIQNPDDAPSFYAFVQTSLFRPVRLFWTEPIVFMVSIMTAVAFGIVYLFIEALQVVYGSYGFSIQDTSLAFIPLSIGLLFGVFVRFYDHKMIAKRKRRGQSLHPEDTLTGFVIAAPVLAVFLWCFAWTIPPRVEAPWIISMIALVPIGFAVNEFDCVLAAYMADSYTLYAASAFASLTILRSTFSATFPLFAHQMYVNLGSNNASSILAGIATVACVSPVLLLIYGRQIREMSKFARYSLQVYNENRVDHTSAESLREI